MIHKYVSYSFVILHYQGSLFDAHAKYLRFVFPDRTTLNTSASPIPRTFGMGTSHFPYKASEYMVSFVKVLNASRYYSLTKMNKVLLIAVKIFVAV